MEEMRGVTLDQLRTFCTLVRLGSFTQAADELCLSQPAVSQQIRTLEKACGTKLLDRMGRRALPTQAGQAVLSGAQEMLRRLEGIRQELDDLQGLRRGNLALASTQIIGIHALPEVLRAFCGRYPEINITLQITFGETMAEQVVNGVFDVALMGEADALRSDRLAISSFLVDELVVVTNSQHPWAKRESVHVSELVGQPFVVPRESSSVRQTIENRLRGSGVGLDTRLQFGSTDGVKRAVEVGLGISVMMRLAITREDVESGRLQVLKLDGMPTHMNTCMSWLKDRHLPKAVETFIAFLELEGRDIARRSIAVPGVSSQDPA